MIFPIWPLSLLTRGVLQWYCKQWDFKATFKLVNSNVSGSFPRTRTKLFIRSTAKLSSGRNLTHSNSFSPWTGGSWAQCGWGASPGDSEHAALTSLEDKWVYQHRCWLLSTSWLWCLFLGAFYLPDKAEPKCFELSTQANSFICRIALVWGKCCTWEALELATIMYSKIRLPVTILGMYQSGLNGAKANCNKDREARPSAEN